MKPTVSPKRKENNTDKKKALVTLLTAASSHRSYEHDCEDCRYLGSHKYNNTIADLYFCRPIENQSTVIARNSSLCSDYVSGMVAATESGEEALYEAARRAIAFEFMTLTEWAKWTAYQRQEN